MAVVGRAFLVAMDRAQNGFLTADYVVSQFLITLL